jgi:serpin B
MNQLRIHLPARQRDVPHCQAIDHVGGLGLLLGDVNLVVSRGTPDDLNQSYKDLVEALVSHDPKVALSVANAIYYRNTFNVKNSFITTNQNFYQAKVQGLDFTKEAETLEIVNDWVKTNTNGKIDKILEKVSPYDVMYLLNAIYFNGEWTYRFNPEHTSSKPFTKEGNVAIQVPMMYIKNPFKYYRNNDFQLLEMPYGSGKYSMLIFLPQQGKTTNEVISMLNPESVNGWLKQTSEQEKEVYLPKFEFKFENSLVDELKALGMKDAFDDKLANLKGISEQQDLLVTAVMHKTYIKVDERGTEAAAVTGITVGTTSIGEDNSFRADHPFVFAIREKDTQAILFIGKVMNPLQE